MFMLFTRLPGRSLVRWMSIVLAWMAAGTAAHAATVQWGAARSAVYDPTYCCTLRIDTPISAQTGGFDLTGATMTTDPSKADLVINAYGSMGAGGVVALNESLDTGTTTDPGSYDTRVSLTAGGVYLVVTRDGKRAKIRVDTITSGKVYFTYRLQATAAPQPTNVSYLVACQREAFPGGVLCAQPLSIGALLTYAEADSIVRNQFGCSGLGSNAYYCGASSRVEPGYLLFYQFTTSEISRIVYLR